MSKRAKSNRNYKDRLFKFVFGKEQNRAWTLSLLNAISGRHYSNPDDITFTTLDDAMYLEMRNDISFLIADTMVFFEQQSTPNPSLPLRLFEYAFVVLRKYVEENRVNLFSKGKKRIPRPRCVCFYNGVEPLPDRMTLCFSDMFSDNVASEDVWPGDDDEKDGAVWRGSDIALRVHVFNINYGHNADLLKKCRPLNDYAFFIDEVRKNQTKPDVSMEKAISMAMDALPADSPIKPYLLGNRRQVVKMYEKEYTMERFGIERFELGVSVGEERGVKIGEERGVKKGEIVAYGNLVHKGKLTLFEAAEELGMTVDEFQEKLAEYSRELS